MSRISAITTHQVSFDLDAPMADSLHYIPGRAALLVEVHTEDGRTGLGESAIYGGPGVSTETVIHDELAPRLLGEDPSQIEALWQRMLARSHQHGDGGILPAAVSGIDIALWDLLGQAAGMPLATLLGGYRKEIQAYASAGFYAAGKDATGLADEAQGYVAAGFKHLKVKVGRTVDTVMNPLVHMEQPEFATVTLREDLARVRAVREAVGEDVHIAVDANNAWDPATALRAGREFEALGIHWFEEPVATEDRQGSAALAAALDVPVAGYETQTGVAGFRDLIQQRAVDIVQPDVIWSGGITACRRVAALAAANNLPCVPHVFSTAVSLAANLHFIAALPNSYLLELDRNPNALRTELLDQPLEPDAKAIVTVPTRPGLGVRLDRETVQRHAVAPARHTEA